MKEIMRAGIYYINNVKTYGREQHSNRPAVVISNNRNNRNSGTVTIVYLTGKRKKPMPTHCAVFSSGRRSTALCEQIDTVDGRRVGKRVGTCTDAEMKKIEECIKIHLEMDGQGGKNGE